MEQLTKIVSLDRRTSDDSRKQDEANKASQHRDQNGRNNSYNDLKDSLDPFKQFSLSVMLAQMVNYLEGKKFVRWLKKMVFDPVKRDNSRNCAFYKEVGHMTEECRILKNEVLKLIQNGYLKEFMTKQKS